MKWHQSTLTPCDIDYLDEEDNLRGWVSLIAGVWVARGVRRDWAYGEDGVHRKEFTTEQEARDWVVAYTVTQRLDHGA